MSRTNRFLSGIGFGYTSQILTTVVAFWLTPFLLRRIGQHDYGLWLIGAQLLAYLGLMDFGIVALLPRATAYATGRASGVREAKDLPEIIGQTIWIVLCQTPLVAVASYLLWLTIPAYWGHLRTPIGIVLVAFVLAFPLRIFFSVLQGLQDLAFLGKLNIGAWGVGIALTVLLIFAGKGLYALAVGWITTQFLTAGACFVRLRWEFPTVLPNRLPSWSWLSARSQVKQGFWISTSQVAQILSTGTDVLIIGMLLGPLAVVPYVCTAKLISMLANQPQMLMQTAFPGLSEMRTGASTQRLFAVCTMLSQAMLLISGAVVCIVLAVNHGFVRWWVGENQYGGFSLTILFVGAMLLGQLNSTWVYPLLSFGRERRISLTNIVNGLFTAGMSLVLIRLIGPRGGPLAAMLALLVVSLPSNFSAVARELKASPWSLLMVFWPWFWRFLIVLCVAIVSDRLWVPTSFLPLTATTLGIGFLYVGLMLPVLSGIGLGSYIRPRLSGIREKLRAFSFGNIA